MSDVKIFKRLAAQIQSGSSYADSAMYLIPFTTNGLNQMNDPIEDSSIVGLAFKDIPQKGPRHISGNITQNLDVVSCLPILEAVFGTPAAGVYDLAGTTNKLSVCSLDAVAANQYANQYIKTCKIAGSASGLLNIACDIFGITSAVRAARSAFPASPTPNDEPFTFHEMDNNTYGFFRVGDAADALGSGDAISVEDFSIDINSGLDEQFDNNGTNSLTPVYGMVGTSAALSFKVSRFDSTQWLTWMDNFTPLQASIRVGKSASKYIQFDIPRFNIKAELSDDDLTKVSVEASLGRNGVGTSYKNTNMSFTAPIRVTVVNS